jgi:DNA polymerase sigma
MERRHYFSNTGVREELTKLYHVRKPEKSYTYANCFGNAQTTVPRQRIREMRRQTVAKVESSIQDHFGHEYRIEVFGSTQYGVDGQTSDLDMIVIVCILLMPHL